MAIRRGFKKTDKKFLDKVDQGGSTAIVAVIKQQDGKKATLYIANVGDSRCVASVKGKAVPLSTDHKVHSPTINYSLLSNEQQTCTCNDK